MANAARKERKKLGIKFVKIAKTGTPFADRSWLSELVPGVAGTRSFGTQVPRSAKKIARAFRDRGLEAPTA